MINKPTYIIYEIATCNYGMQILFSTVTSKVGKCLLASVPITYHYNNILCKFLHNITNIIVEQV